MKHSLFTSKDNAYAQHITNLFLAYFLGRAGSCEPVYQSTPDPNMVDSNGNALTEEWCQRDVAGEPGSFGMYWGACYAKSVWNSASNGHYFDIISLMLEANRQSLTEITGTQWQGPRNIVDEGSPYDISLWDGATEITAYTLDYATGIFTTTDDLSGHKLRWKGYYYVNGVQYLKTKTDTYYEWGLDSTYLYSLLPTLNKNMELWENSSTIKSWTQQGAVTRESAEGVGRYVCRIQATGGSWASIAQTISLGSKSIDYATLLVVMKCDTRCRIRISLDAGATYDQVVFTPTTAQQNKYVILAVTNATSYTTSSVIVDISPQSLVSESGNVWVEHVEVLTGALQ